MVLHGLWDDIKTGAKDLIMKEIPKAVKGSVEKNAVAIATPIVQKQAEEKANRVANKGNIALLAGIGALAGGLIAGQSWTRRGVGAGVGAILGGLAGLKIGILSDT